MLNTILLFQILRQQSWHELKRLSVKHGKKVKDISDYQEAYELWSLCCQGLKQAYKDPENNHPFLKGLSKIGCGITPEDEKEKEGEEE